MQKLFAANVAFTADGVPFSNNFDDIYHSASGGLGQARHVFLNGNSLPERWKGKEIFTIVETGFGMGLNFLATWQTFRSDPNRPHALHFISVEKHPFSAENLTKLHALWPELGALSRELIDRWPPLVSGFHRLHLDRNRVTLTLLFGDAADLLPQLEAKADAFFLDGFAPSKNPDLWSPSLFKEIARLANPEATFATYTAASMVRNALGEAGFVTRKIRGFERKREMLVGYWNKNTNAAKRSSLKRAIVIGAGLSGTHCAERLAARGWTVEIIERHSLPAQEASGNPSGVLYPLLHMGDTTNSRLSRTAFLYAVRHLKALDEEGLAVEWKGNGLLHLASNADEARRLAQIIEHHMFPPEFVRFVRADEATQLADIPVAGAGYWFPQGAWINPPSLCEANLKRHAPNIVRRLNTTALRLEKTTDGKWQVYENDGLMIAEAPVLILANAADCNTLAQKDRLHLPSVRGQITYLPELPNRKLAIGVTGLGYIAPMPAGGYCIGATFQHDDFDANPRLSDHVENLTRLESMLPNFLAGISSDKVQGRVAWRTTTSDRLPVFGALRTGLYLATGLGARGLVWAPLGAELLAAKINDEPWPAERELIEAVSPARCLETYKRCSPE